MSEPLQVISSDQIEMKKKDFLFRLENENLSQIENSTKEQNYSQLWHQERKIRLTASSFGQVCKMRANTSCKNSVYNILYSTNVNAKSLQYGKNMKIVARKKSEEIMNHQ